MSLEDQLRRADEERHKQYATADTSGLTAVTGWIDGYARAAQEAGNGNGYFRCRLITHVEDNLWQGGCRTGIVLPDNFKYVVSLYQWEKYTLPEGCIRQEVEMYDAGFVPEVAQLNALANIVNDYRDREDGDVLVHCQAGLNRSGLVTALSLVKRGYTPENAIKKLREGRSPMVLCNTHFEQWLLAGNYDA